MYEIYDQLDLFTCRDIAYTFSNLLKKGDYKIHISEIKIKKEDRFYKIKRPPTFIKDILRFSINDFNHLTYCIYSVKTAMSVLGKLTRDFSIDGEKNLSDPLMKNVDLNVSLNGSFEQTEKKFLSTTKNNLIINALVNLIYNNKNNNEYIHDLSLLLVKYNDLIKLEENCYSLVANLEKFAFREGIFIDEKISVEEFYSKYEKKLKTIADDFYYLYQNFLESRKSKKLNTKDYVDLVIPKVPFSRNWFSNKHLSKISKSKLEKKISDALDCFYIAVLGQLDTISSTRRHFLRAIAMVLNNVLPNSQEVKSFKFNAKKFEKNSILLFKGFTSKNKRKAYLIFLNFLIEHKKTFDSAIALLSYIESLKFTKKKVYYDLANVKKALIFYVLYISYWDIKFIQRGFELLQKAGFKFYKSKSQKIKEYIETISNLCNLSDSLFKHLSSGIDPFKIKRRNIAKNLKKDLKAIEKSLPIHWNLAMLKHSIYESHTNYKFGPWFNYSKAENMFNPSSLLLVAIALLNRAKGEKISYFQKIEQFSYSNPDKKLAKRILELSALLGQRLNPKLTKYLTEPELNQIKKISPIPFGTWDLFKIQSVIDNVYFSYEKLSKNYQEFFKILEYISKKYLNKEILLNDIFPKHAVPFYYYERDILDQLQIKNRENNSFSNEQLDASLIIEPSGRGKNFHQKLKLNILEYSFTFDFKAKDPSKLKFKAENPDVVFGQKISLEEVFKLVYPSKKNLDIFSCLALAPELLNNRNYYLSKIFDSTDSRFSTHHLNLFLSLLKDGVNNEKGVIVFSKNQKQNYMLEFSATIIEPKYNLSKINIHEHVDLFEKERIFFLHLKQILRFFESKEPITQQTIAKLQKKEQKIY
ncbi:MAG: hypothetical protein NC918_00850 [Candidatus Omnitrophica bacterium]|nr:hypothetical protein [Candidatus Omnitrophota bacterium]